MTFGFICVQIVWRAKRIVLAVILACYGVFVASILAGTIFINVHLIVDISLHKVGDLRIGICEILWILIGKLDIHS